MPHVYGLDHHPTRLQVATKKKLEPAASNDTVSIYAINTAGQR